jgi:lipid-A-disaccharide synthase
MSRPRTLLIVAGEVSGDMHAALLLEALRRRDPSVQAFGIGGDRLRAAGMEIRYDVKDTAVMGFSDVVRRLGFFRRVFKELLAAARERRPDAVLLVDYPGFNLRFAAACHAAGLKVIYYICPQVWAWNRRRIPRMAAVVDRLISIFPFEPAVFAGTGLRVDYAGHPLVDEIHEALAGTPTPLPWAGEPRIALLPGSRTQEIERLLPALCEAAVLIEQQRPTASFLIAAPSAEQGRLIRRLMEPMPWRPARLAVVEGGMRQVLRQARAALVKSGTGSLEAALIGCPAVVVYKTSPLTYWLGRKVVKLEHIGIANLIADRRICPELIQNEATPAAMAAALLPLLDDTPARTAMLAGYEDVRKRLGAGGATEHAADIVLTELGG